jgi:tetratricopeptide (TPR) repeat protein
MARKKRRLEPVAVAESETKGKVRYQDEFQHTVGDKVQEFSKKLEGQGRNILYGIGALAVLAIVVWIIYAWSGRTNAAAQAALGKAIETSQSRVSETSPPAGTPGKTFKTEKERADAAIAEFQIVVDKYGGSAGEKAKYFIAVNKLSIDRVAGIAELEGLAKGSDEVGSLSKFALAQAKVNDGKLDEAAALYSELAGMADPIVSKESINFELAKIYEKQGKKQEAVDLLFNLVKTASEVKDLDGKAVPLSSTAESAKEKLEQLDPAKAKELPQPDPGELPDSPF